MTTRSGYRTLLTRDVLVVLLVGAFSKAPVAMTPLALVFLSRDRPGGYAVGATLASVYILGEVAGAPLLGARLGRRMRFSLAVGLLVGAAAFAALPMARSGPTALLVGLAFVAGAAPAASPGGIRDLLTRAVPERSVAQALSSEATVTQVIWAAAPAAVVFLALRVDPGAPLVLGAVLAVAAAVLLLAAAPSPASAGTGSGWRRPTIRVLASAWPVYLTSAAAMAMLATAELVLPALLEGRGIAVGWAGPLLAAFAVASAVGAFCYGLRGWPGSVHAQSLVLLAATAGCVALVAVLPGLVGVAAGLLSAGLLQSGVMVTRSLSLRARLPDSAHAAGYSVMYAVQGVGYSLTALVSAVALDRASPTVAILGGVLVALVITAVSAVAEIRGPARPGSRDRSAPRVLAEHGG